jgi:hypothetical protein
MRVSAADLIVAGVLLVVLVTLVLVLTAAARRRHHTPDLFGTAGGPLVAIVVEREAALCVRVCS